MEEKISPEEKLLRLIKQRKKNSPASPEGEIKLDYTNKPEKVSRFLGRRGRFIKTFNIGLTAILTGLLCFSIMELAIIKQDREELPQIKKVSTQKIVAIEEKRAPLDFYTGGVYSKKLI